MSGWIRQDRRAARGAPPSPGFPAPEAVRARERGENFPVALAGLPRRLRRHLRAVYGFARLADQLGDEAAGDRLALLDELERDLDRLAAGEVPRHPLVAELAPTVRECALPLEPLRRLIEANRVDQRVARYPTWTALLRYCELSANPVGELVLHIFGAATPDRIALSDRICTALQCVEHWQDLGEDWRRGRVYLPGEDLDRFGCTPEELGAERASPALRALVRFEGQRTRALLASGLALVGRLSGAARLAVAGYAAGGLAALDAIERAKGEVLAQVVRPRRRDILRHLLGLWLGAGSAAAALRPAPREVPR